MPADDEHVGEEREPAAEAVDERPGLAPAEIEAMLTAVAMEQDDAEAMRLFSRLKTHVALSRKPEEGAALWEFVRQLFLESRKTEADHSQPHRGWIITLFPLFQALCGKRDATYGKYGVIDWSEVGVVAARTETLNHLRDTFR
jgi:hypothetical protein